MKKLIATCVATLFVVSATTLMADVELKEVKCVIAPKPAKADKMAEYKDGKVYFCCNNCVSKFKKDTKQFQPKANFQLVATKQYVQKACPFSGGDLDPAISTKVAGMKVGFCCQGCKGKVEKAKDDKAKLALLFNEKTFAKGFKKAETK